MGTLSVFLVSLGILVIHHFLSRRNHPLWGGIVPVAYLGLIVWLFLEKKVGFDFVFILGLLILVGTWGEGRIAVKRKRQKELDKITLQDL